MTTRTSTELGLAIAMLVVCACGSSDDAGKGGASGLGGNANGGDGGTGASATGGVGTGGVNTGGVSTGGVSTGGVSTGGTSGGAAGVGGTAGAGPTYDEVKQWVDAYRTAHPGNGGKDWDINAKTPQEIAQDPAAQQLLALCTPDQRPVIPLLAWEYGGADHQWINPQASALVYCVYTPVNPSSAHWQYDAAADHVTADVYVKFPDQNPCKDQVGAAQISACIGDPTNFEILVDTASLHDGADVGLALANASSDLNLILSDGSKVPLYSAQ